MGSQVTNGKAFEWSVGIALSEKSIELKETPAALQNKLLPVKLALLEFPVKLITMHTNIQDYQINLILLKNGGSTLMDAVRTILKTYARYLERLDLLKHCQTQQLNGMNNLTFRKIIIGRSWMHLKTK